MQSDTPIAVVGRGGTCPGAPTVERFWQNIQAGVDTCRELPPGQRPFRAHVQVTQSPIRRGDEPAGEG